MLRSPSFDSSIPPFSLQPSQSLKNPVKYSLPHSLRPNKRQMHKTISHSPYERRHHSSIPVRANCPHAFSRQDERSNLVCLCAQDVHVQVSALHIRTFGLLFKGTIHQKIQIWSLFSHHYVIPNRYEFLEEKRTCSYFHIMPVKTKLNETKSKNFHAKFHAFSRNSFA